MNAFIIDLLNGLETMTAINATGQVFGLQVQLADPRTASAAEDLCYQQGGDPLPARFFNHIYPT
ncbi:hypothetical protein D3C86_1768090 [compost metagenome]